MPLNAEGQRVGNTWEPSMDGQCQAFGMAGLLRQPTRLRISWQDGGTLKIDQFRDLRSQAGFGAHEGNYRIFLISNAERMTPQAANSMLKLLEERGQVRRGYFVAGLGAAQFAAPGADDRIREPAPEAEGAEPPAAIVTRVPGTTRSWAVPSQLVTCVPGGTRTTRSSPPASGCCRRATPRCATCRSRNAR